MGTSWGVVQCGSDLQVANTIEMYVFPHPVEALRVYESPLWGGGVF